MRRALREGFARLWRPIALACVLLLVAGSCRRVEQTVYSSFQRAGKNGWDPEEPLVFMPWPADSAETLSRTYRLTLHVRYKSENPIPPLPISILIEDDEGNTHTDTVTVALFDNAGHPLGTGKWGIYMAGDTLMRSLLLQPGFLVTLSPLLPKQSTRGILDVGLSLEEEQAAKHR